MSCKALQRELHTPCHVIIWVQPQQAAYVSIGKRLLDTWVRLKGRARDVLLNAIVPLLHGAWESTVLPVHL